jgi:hypothetical protein
MSDDCAESDEILAISSAGTVCALIDTIRETGRDTLV